MHGRSLCGGDAEVREGPSDESDLRLNAAVAEVQLGPGDDGDEDRRTAQRAVQELICLCKQICAATAAALRVVAEAQDDYLREE